jgi:toxin ParE1/3/4
MADITFSALASLDLVNIFEFSVEQFGGAVALDYHAGLKSAVLRLKELPELGPVYPGLRPPIRFLTYRRHHIYYDFDGNQVCIRRILHHAQDVRRMI